MKLMMLKIGLYITVVKKLVYLQIRVRLDNLLSVSLASSGVPLCFFELGLRKEEGLSPLCRQIMCSYRNVTKTVLNQAVEMFFLGVKIRFFK